MACGALTTSRWRDQSVIDDGRCHTRLSSWATCLGVDSRRWDTHGHGRYPRHSILCRYQAGFPKQILSDRQDQRKNQVGRDTFCSRVTSGRAGASPATYPVLSLSLMPPSATTIGKLFGVPVAKITSPSWMQMCLVCASHCSLEWLADRLEVNHMNSKAACRVKTAR